ncbi:hypothetical protein HZY83_06080 [Gemella sp. GH3]|uniref:hypothetical protein n=1 Tax=unclassified Gemella TaxID=2624949 RepID=UPI0015D01791|nr:MULTISPECIES: hypothetical protein [unclassified Gemella]MBF0714240.1 hypothetical protein [Gemella sp. GH3.1]NYS51192.1 hypothetical protein [Gemella sp. GH3]
MILYKNVDFKDLKNILEQGILPISKTNNNNWEEKRRANNSIDVVYLFYPKSKFNSFTNYGKILLEVEVNDSDVEQILTDDWYDGVFYDEYIIDKVSPCDIKKIYAPNNFKENLGDYIYDTNYFCTNGKIICTDDWSRDLIDDIFDDRIKEVKAEEWEHMRGVFQYCIGKDFAYTANLNSVALSGVDPLGFREEPYDNVLFWKDSMQLIYFNNKERKLKYIAKELIDGLPSSTCSHILIEGICDSIDEKLKAMRSPINSYLSIKFNPFDFSYDFKDKVKNLVHNFIKENQDRFFDKKGDFKSDKIIKKELNLFFEQNNME